MFSQSRQCGRYDCRMTAHGDELHHLFGPFRLCTGNRLDDFGLFGGMTGGKDHLRSRRVGASLHCGIGQGTVGVDIVPELIAQPVDGLTDSIVVDGRSCGYIRRQAPEIIVVKMDQTRPARWRRRIGLCSLLPNSAPAISGAS